MSPLVLAAAVSIIIGFLASLLIQQVMRHLLGVRSQWLLTLSATMLTAGACGVCFWLTQTNLDPKSSAYFLKMFGGSLAAALAAGVLAFRFNIHGEEGNHLSWAASIAMTCLVAFPILGILSLLHLVSS